MSAVESNAGGVDAHCHIALYPSPREILVQAEARRLYTIAVTNAPSVFHFTQALANDCLFVRAALGLHPELVRTHAHESERMLELLPTTRFVGEVGLDFSKNDQENRRQQIRVFEKLLERCAAAGDKVLTLHSRRASSEVVAAFGLSFRGVAILHWFSGPVRDLNRAVDAGMYFSVNPAMTRSASGQKLIKAMPRERVLTETDGPFVQTAGRAAEPQDAALVLPHLAAVWGCSTDEAKSTVLANFLQAAGQF